MADRVRIHDVARAVGVSVTTVSQAMNGRGKVSRATRERVRQAAAELGYEPDRIAAALRSRRSGIVGFVSDEIATTPFAGRIVLGAQEEAAARGLTLMLVNSNRDRAVERRQIDVLLAQRIDALLYATMFNQRVRPPDGVGSVPVAIVNGSDETGSTSSVGPDEHGIGLAATRLLLEAGHRRIAHLTIEDPVPARSGRESGYAAAMAEAGLAPHVVEVGGRADAGAGRLAVATALEQEPGTTAVFAFNDQMAMGVYQVAFERGLRIPDRLSVVGVDNLEVVAAELRPGLTTLELPHEGMGRWAVTAVVTMLEDPGAPVRSVLLEAPVVHRGSVVRPV